MGYLSAVILFLRSGKTVANQAMVIHSDDTNANWTRVRVAGLLKAVRMDLEEVFVRAEDAYHMRHNTWGNTALATRVHHVSALSTRQSRLGNVRTRGKRTMSFGEMGARRASAIS